MISGQAERSRWLWSASLSQILWRMQTFWWAGRWMGIGSWMSWRAAHRWQAVVALAGLLALVAKAGSAWERPVAGEARERVKGFGCRGGEHVVLGSVVPIIDLCGEPDGQSGEKVGEGQVIGVSEAGQVGAEFLSCDRCDRPR